MAYNNVIPNEVIHEWLNNNPIPERKEIENPKINIPDEFVTDCLIRYDFEGYHSVAAAYQDHPAFAEVRQRLETRGYIKSPDYPCVNGDRVMKRFQFNGFQLEVGDKFYCAVAWNSKIKFRDNMSK